MINEYEQIKPDPFADKRNIKITGLDRSAREQFTQIEIDSFNHEEFFKITIENLKHHLNELKPGSFRSSKNSRYIFICKGILTNQFELLIQLYPENSTLLEYMHVYKCTDIWKNVEGYVNLVEKTLKLFENRKRF